ncbi:MAG: hypothetical protein ACJ79L_09425 [Anaeromyxobacteraceae bacterium]
MRSRLAVAVIALAAASCGGPVLYVAADLPRFCILQANVAFPAAPAGVPLPAVSTSFTLDLDDAVPLLRTSGAETELHIDDVEVIPRSGAPDLSGVATAVVNALGPSGESVRILAYDRAAAAPPPAQLVLTGDGGDVAPLLVSGNATFQITAAGQPPATAWTADVKTCAHGKSKVPYP